MRDLSELEKRIGYIFKNKDLLKNALCHSSYINEHGLKRNDCNERVEFLGDAVLELVSSEFLYKKLNETSEGDLTKLRASLVCEPALFNDSKEIGLGEFLFMGKGEELTGGRTRPSVVSDAMEALIGAIFLDSGFEEARRFIHRFILSDYISKLALHDAKTALQEMIQTEPGNVLEYEITHEEGPSHNKVFTAAVKLNGKILGSATGANKKEAEQKAASLAIETLKE